MTDRDLTGLPHDVSVTFPAKYDSNCRACNGAIYIGDDMGRVDGEWVCGECHEDAQRENRQALRDMAEAQRERDRAEDPERFARMEAAAKKFTDAVKARASLEDVLDAADAADMAADPEGTTQAKAAAKDWLDRVYDRGAQTPEKEWIPLEGGPAHGWTRNPHYEPEPSNEQEAPVAVEPGIQALMAAGLLSGQEPGGSGVCTAEIHAAGKVTEVQIPVPVAEPVPSPVSGEDPKQARLDQLAAAAADWTPEQAQADALQASLGAAVAAGTMTAEVAASLGWVDPTPPAPADPRGWTAPGANVYGPYRGPGAEPPPPADPGPWDPVIVPASTPDSVWETARVEQARAEVAAQGMRGAPVGPVILDEAADLVLEARTEQARAEWRADPDRAPADLFLDALAAATSGPEEQAILDTLDALPAYVGRDSMEAEKRDLLSVIVGAINNHPRSLQVKIGPSEIGTECDHCLAAKLAGWEEKERGEPWLPTIGTAVHSWIEDAFRTHPEGPAGSRRFLTERRVAVGEIDGEEITGSTDLVDVVAGWTWDWKIVGPTTLKSAKVRPSRRYVVQQMLYARGWNRLGVKVTHVGIAYLPRNAMTLAAGVWWSAPYDPEVAEQALERATNMARNLKAMEVVGGTAARDQFITGLPRWREWVPEGLTSKFQGNAQEGRIVCTDCPRYPDYPADAPGAAADQLDGLL